VEGRELFCVGERRRQQGRDQNDENGRNPFHEERYTGKPREVPTSIRAVLDPKVFKAYDVRGIYPEQLDEEGAEAIGRACVEEFEPRAIAVGRDMRLSSSEMAAALVRGASEAGADVADIGMVGTEMVYFAV